MSYLGERLGNDPRIKYSVLTIISDFFFENDIAISILNEIPIHDLESIPMKFISDYGQSIPAIKNTIISILTNFLKTFLNLKYSEMAYSIDNITFFLIGIMTSEFSNFREVYEVIEFFNDSMTNINSEDEIKLLVNEENSKDNNSNTFSKQNSSSINCTVISKMIFNLLTKQNEIFVKLINKGLSVDKNRLKCEILEYFRHMIYYIDLLNFENFILEDKSLYSFLEVCIKNATEKNIESKKAFKYKLIENTLKLLLYAYNYTRNNYDMQKLTRNFFIEQEQDSPLIQILINKDNDYNVKYMILNFFKELIEQNDKQLNNYFLLKSELVYNCLEEIPKSDPLIQRLQCFILDLLSVYDEYNSKFGLGFEIQINGELMKRIDNILTYQSTEFRSFFEHFQQKYLNFNK